MPDVKNTFVFELSTAQVQIGLNDAYSSSTVLSNSPKERKDWQQKSSLSEKYPKSLIINWLCLGSNTAQNIAYYTFLFQCTYISRKPLASCTTDNHVLYWLSKEKIPDLRLHYFKSQFLGALFWKCSGKSCLTFSASSVLVNVAKTKNIWSHEKKIPLIIILETTSEEIQHSANKRKHHSYSYSKIFMLNFKMYFSISQATSMLHL